MRTLLQLATVGITIFWMVATAIAQPPVGQLAGEEKLRQLDVVLLSWERAREQIDKLECEVEHVAEDRVFRTKDTHSGTFRYMKAASAKGSGPNLPFRASLRIKSDGPEILQHYVLSKERFFAADPLAKQIQSWDLAALDETLAAFPFVLSILQLENQIALIGGMKAEVAKERYKIDLVGEDGAYWYLEIEPRRPRDRAEFAVAQLALMKSTCLPRQFMFVRPNRSRVTWGFQNVNADAKHLREADFDAPALPPGWKLTNIPLKPAAK